MIILVPFGKPAWLKASGVEEAIDKIWQKFVKRPYFYKKTFLQDYYHWECYGFDLNDLMSIRTLMRKHIETLSGKIKISSSNQSDTIILVPVITPLPVWLDKNIIREKFDKIWKEVLHNPFHYDIDEYGNDWNCIRVQWIDQIKMKMVNVEEDESSTNEETESSATEYETESSTNEEYEYETESSSEETTSLNDIDIDIDIEETDSPLCGYACKYDNASDETEPSSDEESE